MPISFSSLDHLADFARKCRGSAGITGIPASLYRQYVIQQARGGLSSSSLGNEDSRFLEDVCKGVDGLGPDMDAHEKVYIHHETLYRLSSFPSAQSPNPTPGDRLPEAKEPSTQSLDPTPLDSTPNDRGPDDSNLPSKPRRKRRPKSK